MAIEDQRPRLFRRLFHRKSASGQTSSSSKLLPSAESLNASAASVVEDNVGSGLWNEVYASFAASTESPDLRAVAKLLREQSNDSSSLITKNNNSHLKGSREWSLCREVLQMAEIKVSELENGTEKPLIRQTRHAYKEIITWTQKFVAMGDIVSQMDPLHIGLPWAGIRAVLIVRSPLQYNLASLTLFYSLLRLLFMIKKHMAKSLRELRISQS